MLQRVQTIYLLLASICVLLMYSFSFAQIDAITAQYTFDHNGLMVNGKNVVDIPYHVVIGVLAAFSFLTIFLYKKRPLQLKMSRLNFLLHLILVVSMFFASDNALEEVPNASAATISYGVGFYLPVAAVAFLLLANRSIKQDEDLIRSLNRLR